MQRRILCGTFVLSASAYHDYYEQALRVRAQLRRDFAEVFEGVDVLLTPTAPAPPFLLRAPPPAAEMYANDIMTVPANLAGLPAISLPVGTASLGVGAEGEEERRMELPVGMQLMARPLDEATLLRAAAGLEAAVAFKRPGFVSCLPEPPPAAL